MDAGGAPAGCGVLAAAMDPGWVGGGVEQCPCLYRFINFEDQVLSGLAPAAHVKKGLSSSQARNGACRSEGLERLVAGQHVPDRLGQLASEFDLGDLRAALAAQAPLGALVALLVERVRGGVDRCFHHVPSAGIWGRAWTAGRDGPCPRTAPPWGTGRCIR